MLKKILHITFAFLVLFGSTGFTLHSHFCGGELQEVSLLKKVNSCCPTDSEDKNDCCRNEYELLQIEENYLSATAYEIPLLLITFFDIPEFLISATDRFLTYQEYHNYRPPLLNIDITVDLQTFLC